MKTHFFRKEERLTSRKQIELLFKNRSSFILYPFRIVWNPAEAPMPYPAKVLVSVSKKKFKRAVDRNRIKRLIREAYRRQKEKQLYSFLRSQGLSIHLMILYVGNEIFTAQDIEKKLNSALNRLQKEHDQRA